MGLDTSHNCWHGSYGGFNAWRTALCVAAGIPPLDLMEGHFGDYTLAKQYPSLPIKWEALSPSALHVLLDHSDCDGEIAWEECKEIANKLEELLPKMGEWSDKTRQFINGLRTACAAKEDVIFH